MSIRRHHARFLLLHLCVFMWCGAECSCQINNCSKEKILEIASKACGKPKRSASFYLLSGRQKWKVLDPIADTEFSENLMNALLSGGRINHDDLSDREELSSKAKRNAVKALNAVIDKCCSHAGCSTSDFYHLVKNCD